MNKKELKNQLLSIIDDRDAILSAKMRADAKIKELEKIISKLTNRS